MIHSIKTIFSLQLLRYLAAIIVVGYHIEESLHDRTSYNINEFFSYGDIGVDIFFVISGFIIALTTSKISNDSRPVQARSFMLKRFIRIVPIYWFYTLLKIVMVLLLPALALRTELQTEHILTSMFFIPDMAPWGLMQPILPVGWTLNFEMLFYLIFTVAILINQNKLLITFFAFLSIFIIASIFPEQLVFQFYAQTIIFEFMLGLIVFEIIKRVKSIPFWLNLSLLILAIIFINNSSNDINRLFTIGVGSFFIVLSFIYFERHLSNTKYKIQNTKDIRNIRGFKLLSLFITLFYRSFWSYRFWTIPRFRRLHYSSINPNTFNYSRNCLISFTRKTHD